MARLAALADGCEGTNFYFDASVEILQAPRHAGLPGDLIEVVRESRDHMHEPKVGKICSKP
jgi:hypothetical protein